MENRKNIQATQIIDYVKDIWSLSMEEEEVLDAVLIFLARQNTEKIKQLSYLLNNETQDLLETLNDREVAEYASEELDFIPKDDEDGLVDALRDLNFDFIDEVKDSDMIDSLENDGWTVTMDKYDVGVNSIVDESQFNEMSELFLNLSVFERENVLKTIKK